MGYVCEKVAHRHGRPMRDVMRDPWALTLFTFAMIVDAERIEGLQARVRQQHAAGSMAFAFHKPEKLGDEARRLDRELRLPPSERPKPLTDAEFRAAANALLAKRGLGPMDAH